jgi:hypothetical protein
MPPYGVDGSKVENAGKSARQFLKVSVRHVFLPPIGQQQMEGNGISRKNNPLLRKEFEP